jgi:hypothetical protein
MNREELEAIARERFKPCTWPSQALPPTCWHALEAHFGCTLPIELYQICVLSTRYHLQGDYLPIEEIRLTYDIELSANPHWSDDFIPFYAVGNGDYLCVSRSEAAESGVYYVAHDDPDTRRIHASVADYIRDAEWFS